MKKLKIFLLLSLALGMLLAFCSCGAKALGVPTKITIDEENVLTWSKVSNAYSYVVQIENVETGKVIEKSPRKESLSLSDLKQGDYNIRIKSVARGKEYKDSAFCEDHFFEKEYETGCLYTLINNRTEYEITKVGKASGVVLIKPEYRNKPLTRIADSAFRGSTKVEQVLVDEDSPLKEIGAKAFFNCSKLTKVVLPDGVKTIGDNAFNSCRVLESVNIPTSVTTISDFAFSYCRSLTEIDLHDKITSIGEAAFTACSALTELEIPDSVTTIGEDAFSECTALVNVTIGAGVSYIPANAFYTCTALESVVFDGAGNLTTIGDYAFAKSTSLATIVIPDGVESINAYAFSACEKLANVTLSDTIKKIGYNAFASTAIFNEAVFGQQATGMVYVGDWLVHCTDEVKNSLKVVNSTTLKEGVVGIADYVFSYSGTQLNKVETPTSLKYIGAESFSSCLGLRELKIVKDSVVDLASGAFAGCAILQNVSLNDGLEKIGSYAFSGCLALSNRTDNKSWIPDTVTQIGTEAFKNTYLWNAPGEDGIVYADDWVVGYNTKDLQGSIGTVTLKDGTIGIADYAFFNCTITSLRNMQDVIYVGEGAFYQCESLGTVAFGADVTEIRDYTFYKCTSLLSVTFPNRLESIGRSAFYKCERLNRVELARCTRLKEMGDYAFYGCSALHTVVFGGSLTEIPDRAFYKCISLEKVVIPDTVTRIGVRSFYKCESLSELTLGSQVAIIDEYAFSSCSSLQELEIPNSVTTINRYAFYKCSAVETLTLSNSVTSIGDYAFYGLEKIPALTLPSSLKSVGKYAFKGLSGIQSILLKADLSVIEAHAFYGAKNATVYTDADASEVEWNKRWNSSYRPVVWGCTLSDDGKYVVSVTITESTLQNFNAQAVIEAPERAGKRFIGWATSADATEGEWKASEIVNVPVGTTIYAIWA